MQAAGFGPHRDGGGLFLKVTETGASWVFRFTSPAGKRREMGLGACHRGSAAQAGASLTAARDLAHRARELLRNGVDPIDAREGSKEAAQAAVEAPALLSALLDATPHERARNLRGDKVPETVMRIRPRLDAVFEDAIFHKRASVNPAAAIRRKMREAAPPGARRASCGHCPTARPRP